MNFGDRHRSIETGPILVAVLRHSAIEFPEDYFVRLLGHLHLDGPSEALVDAVVEGDDEVSDGPRGGMREWLLTHDAIVQLGRVLRRLRTLPQLRKKAQLVGRRELIEAVRNRQRRCLCRLVHDEIGTH